MYGKVLHKTNKLKNKVLDYKCSEFFILISFIFVLPAQASKTLVLGTFKIPQYVQSNSRGEFIELAARLAKENGYDLFIIESFTN